MGKKDQSREEEKLNRRVESVLQLVKKQSPPLTPKQVNFFSISFRFLRWFPFSFLKIFSGNKQEKFCNNACIERFLRAKGDNAKKAAKHLRACLAWRETIGTGKLFFFVFFFFAFSFCFIYIKESCFFFFSLKFQFWKLKKIPSLY